MYNKDPKEHEGASRYGKIKLAELLESPPETNMIDWTVFTSWRTGKNIETIQIINGLKEGELTKAMAGEDVGTVITKE